MQKVVVLEARSHRNPKGTFKSEMEDRRSTPFSCRSFPSFGSAKVGNDDASELQFTSVEMMPTSPVNHCSCVDGIEGDEAGKSLQLGAQQRREFIDRLISNVKEDNRQMLERMKKRIDQYAF